MVDGKTHRTLSAEELAKASCCVVDDDGHEGVAASWGGGVVSPRDVAGTR